MEIIFDHFHLIWLLICTSTHHQLQGQSIVFLLAVSIWIFCASTNTAGLSSNFQQPPRGASATARNPTLWRHRPLLSSQRTRGNILTIQKAQNHPFLRPPVCPSLKSILYSLTYSPWWDASCENVWGQQWIPLIPTFNGLQTPELAARLRSVGAGTSHYADHAHATLDFLLIFAGGSGMMASGCPDGSGSSTEAADDRRVITRWSLIKPGNLGGHVV